MGQGLRRLGPYKYRILLGAIVTMMVGFPIAHDCLETWVVQDALMSLVFVAALRVIFFTNRLRVPAVLLGVPALAGAWAGYLLPGPPHPYLLVAAHVLAAAFLVFAVAAILLAILRQEVLTSDSLAGAFCGYLLLGLAFAHVFFVLETLHPGSFRAEESLFPVWDTSLRLRFVLNYFSFCTLTTVGYGDIHPATSAARAFSMAEAITGQFYLVVVMAELIGLRVAQVAAAAPGSGGQPG